MTPHDDISVPPKEMAVSKPIWAVQAPPSLFPLPPLLPYQRLMGQLLLAPGQPKVYVNASRTFPVENHNYYNLTVNAWANLGSKYKQSVGQFLHQYMTRPQTNDVPRRYTKRKLASHLVDTSAGTTTDNSDTEASDTGMRTRRGTKRSAATSVSSTPMPDDLDAVLPRKKKSKPAPLLALQQQALVDESIPDFSPDAFKTLPAENPKCLKIEWKGQPMDLSTDPNLDKLHPAEAVLASILRLPVFVYLDSKRRMFFEKVQRMKQGKQFRRTDAQKACRIDVNKALRLFAAFEKVGWLNDEHFTQYL